MPGSVCSMWGSRAGISLYPLTMQRKIIHIDADCFYAAIEMRDHPELRGIPMAVGGSAERRGVLAVLGGALLVTGTAITANEAEEGGGAYVEGGSLVLADGTLLEGNTASGGSASAFLVAGSIHYVLAAPPGRYVSKTGVAECDNDPCPFAPGPELLGPDCSFSGAPA